MSDIASIGQPRGKGLRILFVDTESFWRGGQEQLLSLMAGMQERGHEVWVACPKGAPLSLRAKRMGARVLRFRQRSEASLSAVLAMYRLLRDRHIDILHLNTPKPILSGGLASRLASVGAVVASRRVNFPLKSRFSAVKYNLFVDRVFTVSTSIQATLIQGGVHQELVEVVYEGVDLAWTDSLKADSEIVTDGGPVIGIVAHLSPEKGHNTLLQAVSILKDTFPHVRLVIVGDGQLRQELEARVAALELDRQVIFTGFRTDSDALMKQFDVFCMPSLSEGLSSAILSAMANGIPVVSTSVGGIPELVVDGETGFLVPPERPELLAGALEKLLEDGSLRQRFGTAGRKRIAASFTVSQKLDRTEQAYLNLLGRNGTR